VRRFLLAVLILAAALVVAPSASARFLLDAPGESWVRVEPKPAPHLIAFVRPGGAVALHARPFGPVVERVGSSTQFGSPRALAVVRTHGGRWLAVTQRELGNHRLGWVDARDGGLGYSRTPLRLEVDLSSRTLLLYRGQDLVRRMLVGVGRAGSETPTGRYAVTDKLPGPAYSSSYGCCILALSATQPNLPSGWTGGNRIAIHGTPSASDFGRAISAGCLHARDSDLRYLMRSLPLGTPVVIRP
jgi:hypothetical protein